MPICAEEREAEITSQIGDLPSFFAALDFLDPGLTPWTLLIMQATLRFAATVTHRIKFGLNCPRPLLFSPLIQPMLLTPTHGAFPSAHATEAHALATVLTRLTDGDPVVDLVNGGQRFLVAERIAVNRTVAGVHYPVDSACGAVLGLALGQHLASCGEDGAAVDGWGFDGGSFVQAAAEARMTADFNNGVIAALLEGSLANGELGGVGRLRPPEKRIIDPVFPMVWQRAKQELLSLPAAG